MTEPSTQPDPNWQPPGTVGKNRFLPKLGVYLLGVAIGLLFLGWVQYQKHQATQTQQATPPIDRTPQQPAPEPASP